MARGHVSELVRWSRRVERLASRRRRLRRDLRQVESELRAARRLMKAMAEDLAGWKAPACPELGLDVKDQHP